MNKLQDFFKTMAFLMIFMLLAVSAHSLYELNKGMDKIISIADVK